MKKSELKRILKPIVRECIKDVLLEEGLLSNIVSEVTKGLTSNMIVENNIRPKTKPNKPNKHKNKCYLCKKKLKMIYFTCKCKHHFCIIHQNPHTHSCLYNYKKEKEKEIEKNNPKLETKLVKI